MANPVYDRIVEIGERLYAQLERGEPIALESVSRHVSNLVFDEATRAYRLGEKKTVRSVSKVKELRTILQFVAVLNFIRQCMEQNELVSLRELYYTFKNREINGVSVSFDDQSQSNMIVEEIECLLGCTREDMNVLAEPSGAQAFGNLVVYDGSSRSTIDFSSNTNIQVPQLPHMVKVKRADFDIVLAVETSGLYSRIARALKLGKAQRLAELRPLLVSTKGVPSRAVRQFIGKLHSELGKPVFLFTDFDQGGLNIALYMQSGSAKSAHLPLAIPDIRWINSARDIVEYDLPAERMGEAKIKAFRRLLNDPRVKGTRYEKEINDFVEMGLEAEGEALARQGIYYIVTDYLPEKIAKLSDRNAYKPSSA